MKRICLLLALLGLLAAAPDARAQLSSSGPLGKLFREVIAKPNQSTVRVRADGENAALGVIVSADGWILSKLSELKGKKEIICVLPGGQELAAEVFGSNEPFDLVMLKVDAVDLTPIEWTDSKASKVGHWVASVGTAADPVAIGVVSVAAREVKEAKYAAPNGGRGGYLGIDMDTGSDGVKVKQLRPDGPALKAGIKAEDLILSVSGQSITNSDQLAGIISGKKPGDVVVVKVRRDDQDIDIRVTLGVRKSDQQNNMGSKLSERKAGFPVVLQHDSVLKPTDCGGPLVNLEGKVLGINIARAGRTESYAIPSETVRPLLEGLKRRTGNSKEEKKTPSK